MEAWAESPKGEFGACVGVCAQLCVYLGRGRDFSSECWWGVREVGPEGTGPEGQQEQDLEHADRSLGGGRTLCSLLSASCA